MSMKHIGTKILAGVLVVLLAGAGVLIWRNLPRMHRAGRSRRRPFAGNRRCSRTPQRPCAWRAILWRTCRLSRMRGTAKRMILRTCSRTQGGITRLRITQRPVWRPRSTVRRIGLPAVLRTGCAGLRPENGRVSPASTASNHSLDTWYSGLVRTLDMLDAAGLEHRRHYRTQQSATR